MKRIAIFAHYDKDNIIDDYVLLYLEFLKEVVDDIIFVSDCNLDQSEISKLSHLVLESVCKKHGEYDFGSYKRGYLLFKEKYSQALLGAQEVVFANDSCYCVRSLKEAFNKMSAMDYDFWGLTQSKFQYPEHIQSYFLVFSKTVIKSDCFINFIKGIKQEKSKDDVIRYYESGITQTLVSNGFKKGSFIERIFDYNPAGTPRLLKKLLNDRMPLIKVNLMVSNISGVLFLDNKIKCYAGNKVFCLIKKHRDRIIKDIVLDYNRRSKILFLLDKINILNVKVTKKGVLIIKFLKIPVFYRRIKNN